MTPRSSLLDTARSAAALIEQAVASGSLPAGVFGLATVDQGIVLSASYGPVTVDTAFSLASTTKPIATTVLGALLDEGSLSLDQAITTLVPELPDAVVPGRAVTVRDLAAHTGGLGIHHRFFYADERPPVELSEAVGLLARPALPVGGQWRYSNLGYGVLQLAMERATATPMEALVQRHVYEPLRMTSSAWGGVLGPPDAAPRHLTADEHYPGYVTDHPSASEAWCSLTDLLHFGLAHASASLLQHETHALLTNPTAPRQSDGAAYALGWVTREHGGHRLLVHGGRMGGVSAHLTVVPSLGLVVAAMANRETEQLADAVAIVLRALVPGYAPPVPTPPGVPGSAHPMMRRHWAGELVLGMDRIPATLDASGARISFSVDGITCEVMSPQLRPDVVAGHVSMALTHPLVPADATGHLDAVPVGDDIVGGLTIAQYPNDRRRRQGDAITAALHLVAE